MENKNIEKTYKIKDIKTGKIHKITKWFDKHWTEKEIKKSILRDAAWEIYWEQHPDGVWEREEDVINEIEWFLEIVEWFVEIVE